MPKKIELKSYAADIINKFTKLGFSVKFQQESMRRVDKLLIEVPLEISDQWNDRVVAIPGLGDASLPLYSQLRQLVKQPIEGGMDSFVVRYDGGGTPSLYLDVILWPTGGTVERYHTNELGRRETYNQQALSPLVRTYFVENVNPLYIGEELYGELMSTQVVRAEYTQWVKKTDPNDFIAACVDLLTDLGVKAVNRWVASTHHDTDGNLRKTAVISIESPLGDVPRPTPRTKVKLGCIISHLRYNKICTANELQRSYSNRKDGMAEGDLFSYDSVWVGVLWTKRVCTPEDRRKNGRKFRRGCAVFELHPDWNSVADKLGLDYI